MSDQTKRNIFFCRLEIFLSSCFDIICCSCYIIGSFRLRLRVRLFNSSFQASHYHNTDPFHPMSYYLYLKPTWKTKALERSVVWNSKIVLVLNLVRYWETRTHCCSWSFLGCAGKHLLRTENVSEQNQKHFLCPGHKICVHNKCCARGQTGKHLCRQQCVRNNVSRLPVPVLVVQSKAPYYTPGKPNVIFSWPLK